jgi:hypothetical protein
MQFQFGARVIPQRSICICGRRQVREIDGLTEPAFTGPRYMNETHQVTEKSSAGDTARAVAQGQRIHIRMKEENSED